MQRRDEEWMRVTCDASAERRIPTDETVVDVDAMHHSDLAADTARRKQNLSCVAKRFKSISYACKGAKVLLKQDPIQAVFVFHVWCFVLAALVETTKVEWCLLLITFCVHLMSESLNSAVEAICDFIHPEFHASIGAIKDVGAAAVLFTVVCVVLVNSIVIVPHIISKLFQYMHT